MNQPRSKNQHSYAKKEGTFFIIQKTGKPQIRQELQQIKEPNSRFRTIRVSSVSKAQKEQKKTKDSELEVAGWKRLLIKERNKF